MSPVKTPYSQPNIPIQTTSKGLSLFSSGKSQQSSLLPWVLISIGSHVAVICLIWLAIFILGLLGLIHKFDDLTMKSKDTEFVLVDNLPNEKPRNPTKNRAEHASRSGGTKVSNHPVAMPQQAAGPAAKAHPSAAQHSTSRPQPTPRPAARPAQQPRVAQAPSRPQPQSQPQQHAAPTPRPTPPAPKLPTPTKIASTNPTLPPNPIAPTIRTPAPRNPSLSGAGPIVKTPGSSYSGSSSGSSGASGSPGPSMISGAPSRSGFSGGRSGGGGGGSGTYNQSGSPGGGGGRPGIDAEAEPDFGAYIAELQRRIRRNWAPPTEDRSKRIVAVFRIGRDGRLLSLSISQSSGSPLADQQAIAAVRASAPFRPLPPNYRGNDIPVQFTFDYEISGHGSANMRF